MINNGEEYCDCCKRLVRQSSWDTGTSALTVRVFCSAQNPLAYLEGEAYGYQEVKINYAHCCENCSKFIAQGIADGIRAARLYEKQEEEKSIEYQKDYAYRQEVKEKQIYEKLKLKYDGSETT